MPKQFSLEQKVQLLKEFHLLTSIAEKFQFWEDRLEYPYFRFLCYQSPYYKGYNYRSIQSDELKEFLIIPEANEIEKYNKKIISLYKSHTEGLNISYNNFEVDDLIKDFEKTIEPVENKIEFLNNRISSLDNSVHEHEIKSQNDQRSFFFLRGYYEQAHNNKEPDLSTNIYDCQELISLLQGSSMAKFKRFLIQEQSKKAYKAFSKGEPKPLTIKQMLLVLHYLSILERIGECTAVDKGKFLGRIFGMSSDNIRAEFSSIAALTSFSPKEESRASKIDMKVILDAFTLLGISSIVEQIKKDTIKLGYT
jgi:hypothetical protein